MKREALPAALLRTLVSAAGGDTSLACGAEFTRMGWTLVYGGFVLRSARVPGPRFFQTLEALVRVAAGLGFDTVNVRTPELVAEKEQSEKRSVKRRRKSS